MIVEARDPTTRFSRRSWAYRGGMKRQMTVEPLRSSEAVAEGVALPDRSRRHADGSLRPIYSGVLRSLVGATFLCVVFVAAATALADRPFASWVHERLADQQHGWFTASYAGQSLRFGPFGLMAIPAEILGRLAALAFVVLAISASAGWRVGTRGRILLALCLSVFASTEINGILKEAFGRTWPESWLGDNPSWIRDGVFGFFPFHGGQGWASFPSGHTAVIAAPAAVLWQVWPQLRMLWGVLVAIVIAGLILGNFHFVSDTIAGLYVGAGIGLAITKLILTSNDRMMSGGQSEDLPPPQELPIAKSAANEMRDYAVSFAAAGDPTSMDGNRTDKTIVSPKASQEWTTPGPKAT